jgi:UDP-N-acetylmuramate dehydrogenase
LQRDGHREEWPAAAFEFEYRSSWLKRQQSAALILSASFILERSTPEAVQATLDENSAYRQRTQPPGASMGSMFKNPPADFAGRLIEAAGLKGKRIGGAEISPVHANFFINHEDATAADIYELIQLTRQTVGEKFGVNLELEIELLGEW